MILMNNTFDFSQLGDITFFLSKKTLPVKYAYTSSAAEYHTKYAKSLGYSSTVKMSHNRYDFLRKYINENEFNYCELGSDDGEVSIGLINYLEHLGITFKSFLFCDFSSELLKKCQENFVKEFNNRECQFIKCDFEKKLDIPRIKSNRQLILFLGNTLGNVECEEDVLSNISDYMNEDDYILIGVTLWNRTYNDLEAYSSIEFREAVLEYLKVLGIKVIPEYFHIHYDEKNHTVICEYEIVDSYSFMTTQLAKGDKLRCFKSKRYSITECEELFRRTGFNIIEATTDAESRHALFLLKKCI